MADSTQLKPRKSDKYCRIRCVHVIGSCIVPLPCSLKSRDMGSPDQCHTLPIRKPAWHCRHRPRESMVQAGYRSLQGEEQALGSKQTLRALTRATSAGIISHSQHLRNSGRRTKCSDTPNLTANTAWPMRRMCLNKGPRHAEIWLLKKLAATKPITADSVSLFRANMARFGEPAPISTPRSCSCSCRHSSRTRPRSQKPFVHWEHPGGIAS